MVSIIITAAGIGPPARDGACGYPRSHLINVPTM